VVNLGAFLAVATAYLAKDVGYWAAYSVPGLLYFMLPILLFIVNKRLVKLDPGGSALSDFIRVNFLALKKAGIRGIGRNGYCKYDLLGAKLPLLAIIWELRHMSPLETFPTFTPYFTPDHS
jgi:hypothetical protein